MKPTPGLVWFLPQTGGRSRVWKHARPAGRARGPLCLADQDARPPICSGEAEGEAGTRQGNQGIVHVGNRPPEGDGLRLRHGERDYAGLTLGGGEDDDNTRSLSPCLPVSLPAP